MQSLDDVGFSFFLSVEFVPTVLYMYKFFDFMEFAR